jgi:hypothetical protein
MNDPIVVWPPGTYMACGFLGLWDCTGYYPALGQEGYTLCCMY